MSEIVGTGFCYPSDIVDNDAYFARCAFPITDDREALIRETRMKTRRWCGPGENTWTMARDAVRMAVRNVDASEIDLVVVSSCSTIPGVHYPNPENPVVADLAPLILHDLARDQAYGFDLKATYCAGFVRAFELADSLLETGPYRAAVVVASDVGGHFATAPSNRSAFCFVIGDAAGAVVLRKSRKRALIDVVGRTIPSLGELTSWGPDGRSIIVKGRRAAATTLDLLVESARSLLSRNRLSPRDVQWLLPMQTHAGAVDALSEALGWPADRVLYRGDVNGYAASASIPASLAWHVNEGIVRRGDRVLSVAVGAGMNCAGALFEL